MIQRATLSIGNTPELTLPEAGVTEAKWQQQFGNVVRIRASMGVGLTFLHSASLFHRANFPKEDRLWVADPTALRHILQISGYNYPKPTGDTAIFELLADRGIVWAQGKHRCDPALFQLLNKAHRFLQVMCTNGIGKPCYQLLECQKSGNFCRCSETRLKM